jgi:hypothetical protein
METGRFIDITIPKQDIFIRKSNVLELLGYDLKSKDEHVESIIESCIAESSELLNPTGGILVLRNEKLNFPVGKLFVNGSYFEIGKIIASQIKNTEYSIFFMCTIGNKIEEIAKQKMDHGDLLEGYIYDLIGSEAVEEVASIIHNHVKENALTSNLKITNRFSPGYCNWDIKEQFKLFELFADHHFDIQLNESALMKPVKSISGMVGAGAKAEFKSYTCNVCTDMNCIYRNRKSFNS